MAPHRAVTGVPAEFGWRGLAQRRGLRVTELNASNGSLVRVLTNASYKFNEPIAIAFDGTHLWIGNATGNSVTEVNASDGSLVRVLTSSGYGIQSPFGIVYDGAHVWVVNSGGNW